MGARLLNELANSERKLGNFISFLFVWIYLLFRHFYNFRTNFKKKNKEKQTEQKNRAIEK